MLSIGLDVGTQGTKCVVYDVDTKEIKGRGAVSYGLNSERHGQAEQDPAVWIQVRYGSNGSFMGLLRKHRNSHKGSKITRRHCILLHFPPLKLLSTPLIRFFRNFSTSSGLSRHHERGSCRL